MMKTLEEVRQGKTHADDREQVDVYGLARSVFDGYGALEAPWEPDNHYSRLQLALARWQNKNFGATQAMHMSLGIGEEVGELIDALHESPDPDDETRRRLVGDAIADINIFGMNLATLLRLDYNTLLNWDLPQPKVIASVDYFHKLVSASGRLQHAVLKNSQNIRGLGDQETFRQHAGKALAGVGIYSRCIGVIEGFDCDLLVHVTAHEVMKRDWTKKS